MRVLQTKEVLDTGKAIARAPQANDRKICGSQTDGTVFLARKSSASFWGVLAVGQRRRERAKQGSI